MYGAIREAIAMRKPKRKKTPPEVETRVLTRSSRRCALCFQLDGDRQEKEGQIAHLDKQRTNNVEDNLVWLCLRHHSRYDSKTSQHKNYTIHEVKEARKALYDWVKRRLPPKQAHSKAFDGKVITAWRAMATQRLVRIESYSELLGTIELELPNVNHTPHSDFTSVDITVSLDTTVSNRLNLDGSLQATLSNGLDTVHRGKLISAEVISFEDIQVSSAAKLIIDGIRGDATLHRVRGGMSALVEVIAANSKVPPIGLLRESVTIGSVRRAFVFSAEAVGSPASVKEGIRGSNICAHSFLVHFESQFRGAFKTREQEGGDGVSPADHGTVLVATLKNVPKGYSVFTTAHELKKSFDQALTVAVSTDFKGLRTKSDPIPAHLKWGETPMVEITETGLGTWEVTNSAIVTVNPKLTFGISLIGPPLEAPFSIQVGGALGPWYAPSSQRPGVRTATTTFPLPRFNNLEFPIEVKFGSP